MNQAKETNNPVKEYKEKIKRLNQKELIKAFNNANPDRVKSKEEKEQDEYFEAKKKALKEYYDSMVAKIELEYGIELTRYMESSKSEKKSVIKRWIKQHNVTFKKEKEKYIKLYAKAWRILNKEHVRLYYEINKDKINSKTKAYRKKNSEKLNLYHKKYHQANKDQINLRRRNYYKNNKNHFIVKNKEYYEKNKEDIKLKKKAYSSTTEGKERKKNYNKIYRQKQKDLKLQQESTTQEIN
jgi:hypothetical protein